MWNPFRRRRTGTNGPPCDILSSPPWPRPSDELDAAITAREEKLADTADALRVGATAGTVSTKDALDSIGQWQETKNQPEKKKAVTEVSTPTDKRALEKPK